MNKLRKILFKLLFPEYFELNDWLHEEMFPLVGKRLKQHDKALEELAFRYLTEKFQQ